MRADGLQVESFNGMLLHEPWTIQNRNGKPYQAYSRFWKHCLTEPDPTDPLPAPRNLIASRAWPESVPLDALRLEPRINWTEGIRAAWQPGTVTIPPPARLSDRPGLARLALSILGRRDDWFTYPPDSALDPG